MSNNLTDIPMIKEKDNNFTAQRSRISVSKDQFYCFRAQKGTSTHKNGRHIYYIYYQLQNSAHITDDLILASLLITPMKFDKTNILSLLNVCRHRKLWDDFYHGI